MSGVTRVGILKIFQEGSYAHQAYQYHMNAATVKILALPPHGIIVAIYTYF